MVMEKTVGRPQRHFASLGAVKTVALQKLYSIYLYDLDKNKVVEQAALDPSETRATAEYFFNVAPRSINFDEPFATKIVPTQNGGKFIERQGSIFKMLRLQGTTGLRPKKQAPNVVPLFSAQPFQTLASPALEGLDAFTERREIPKEEVTGFDDIHFLRNIFRYYSDLCHKGAQVVMVWRNIKDDDNWIIEPKEFKLIQSSKSPLTYEYSITAEAVSTFKFITFSLDDPQNRMRNAQRLYSRLQEQKQALTNSFLVISTQINRIKAAGYLLTDSLLGSLTDVIRGIDSVVGASKSVAPDLIRTVADAIANLTDAIETLSTTLESDGGRSAAINAMRTSLRALYRLSVEQVLRDDIATTNTIRARRLGESYVAPDITGVPRTPRHGGSPAYQGNAQGAERVGEERVRRGETIRDLARRTLGDARRWHEIATLNDLRAPYTTDDPNPGEGVLTVGDPFLYPAGAEGVAGDNLMVQPVNAGEDENQAGVGELLAQTYGRDLRLRSIVTAGGVELTDISIKDGDLDTIGGVANVEQAVRIKFATEVGELPSHPRFGAQFAIGSKASITSFNDFRINTISTLSSDSRVTDVTRLEFVLSGDLLYVDADITLTNNRNVVSTNFAIRRF